MNRPIASGRGLTEDDQGLTVVGLGEQQGVEHLEIALAGDAERHPGAVRAERRDHQLSAA